MTSSRPDLAFLGGRPGRYAATSRWLSPLAGWTVLAALPAVAALTRQTSCMERGWQGQVPLWRQCYSDLAGAVPGDGVGRGLTAYLNGEVRIDQPPLTGALLSLIGGLSPGETLATQRWVVGAWAVVATVCLVAITWMVSTSRGHPHARPVLVALSPVAALTLLVAPDILGVALATGGLWAWTRQRPVLAGMLLGLGAAARTYPILVLVLLVLDALRERRLRDATAAAGTFLLTVVVTVGVFVVVGGPAVLRSWTSWFASADGMGAPVFLATLLDHPLPPGILTAVSALGWLVALAVGAKLVLGRGPRPTLAAALVVVVAVVLVTGRSFPVQASLWLVPLVALAGVRSRDYLIWVGAEAAHFVAIWLYVGGKTPNSKGLPPAWYAVFLTVRVAGVLYLAWRAWAGPRRFPGDSAGSGVTGYPGAVAVAACGELSDAVGRSAYPPVTERP